MALNRSVWKEVTYIATNTFESNRVQQEKQTPSARKGILTLDNANNPDTLFPFPLCQKINISAAGLASHMRYRHQNNVTVDYDIQPLDNVCTMCDKVCKSSVGLKSIRGLQPQKIFKPIATPAISYPQK